MLRTCCSILSVSASAIREGLSFFPDMFETRRSTVPASAVAMDSGSMMQSARVRIFIHDLLDMHECRLFRLVTRRKAHHHHPRPGRAVPAIYCFMPAIRSQVQSPPRRMRGTSESQGANANGEMTLSRQYERISGSAEIGRTDEGCPWALFPAARVALTGACGSNWPAGTSTHKRSPPDQLPSDW